MSQHANSRETRAIGWYAVRWVHVTDWFRAYSDRLRHGHRQPPLIPTLTQPTILEQTQPPAVISNATETTVKADKAKERQKLQTVAKESRGILAMVHSIWPLTIFRDTLTIDRHKLTINYRAFFGVEQEVSVPIETIKNIQAYVGPFFGSVTVTSDNFINNTQTIRNLKRSDVKLVQRLVQGAMVAVKEKIDISKVETKDLRKQLLRLGESHH